MFINSKSGRPAWLVSHDGDVTYSLGAPGDEAHPNHTLPGHEFFALYREATPEELKEHSPRRGHAGITLPATKAAKAPKPKAADKPGKRRPATRKAAAPAPAPAAADKPPAAAAAAAGGEAAPRPTVTVTGGEPHGEAGRQTR